MKHIGPALFVLFFAVLALANIAAVVTWIAGGSWGATLANILITIDIVTVVGVLAAGGAFVAVFLYAMSKDSS